MITPEGAPEMAMAPGQNQKDIFGGTFREDPFPREHVGGLWWSLGAACRGP